ncbi:intermembrane phospholipid transport protein YdbH family protein [Parathalassolituus penaei]|uniref:YdbH domain-containing protein n=1 Tax=Parathalassolituus penaei TaxID=2997323 RepID=A0A9X3ED49_9GAMM|nr:YdbH domain-containing protein [Parathalassolituus penaei]MCY0964976.1 YdbH domain-containing protein [Parathalassolituus penaei]
MQRPGWLNFSNWRAGKPLLLVLLCMIAIPLTLPYWLRPLLNQSLPGAAHWLTGLELQLHIDHLSWQRLDISTARLQLTDGSEAELHNLHLEFPALWQNRQTHPRRLDIEQLTITLNQQGSQLAVAGVSQAGRKAGERLETAIEQQQPINLPQLQDWLALPLDSIRIHTLSVHHPWLDASLASQLNVQQWRVYGDVQLKGLDQPWQLESQLSQSGQLLLQLSEQETLLLQLYANIQQDQGNTRIDLRQQLELAALYPRLQQASSSGLPVPTGLPIPGPQLISTVELQLPAAALLPRDLSIHSNTRLPLATGTRQPWQQLDGELQISLDHNAGAQWDWQILSPTFSLAYQPADGQRLQVRASQLQVSGQCDDNLRRCEFTQQGEVGLQQSGQSLTVNPAVTGVWENEQLDISANPTLTASTPFGPLNANASTSIHWQSEQIRLTINSLQARLQPDKRFRTQTGWSSQPLLMKLQEAANLTLIPHPQLGYRIEAAPWKITTDPLRLTRNKDYIQLGGGSLECQPSMSFPQCQLDLRVRDSHLDPWPIPAARLFGPLRWQASSNQIDADLQLQAANQQLLLRSRLQHNLSSGDGSAQWHLDRFNLNWQAMGLKDMENLTGVQLLAGQLSGQGWLDWDKQGELHPDMMLRADDISLIWNNSLSVEGWDFLLALREPPGSKGAGYVADAQLTASTLNNGLNFSNLLARARLQIPADFSWYLLDLEEINTDVLGGRIHIPAAHYDSREAVNAFNVSINNLQLAEMAALEPSAEVQANGVMDGLLPIVITAAGPSVPDGTLFARAPGGAIRYHNDTSINLSNADPTVGLAMQALKNFQFRELGSTINYQPDGSLHLAMKFEGKNPDFFGGQSTNLNINLDYNLLDLLESLRVADDIISRVEKKYGQ